MLRRTGRKLDPAAAFTAVGDVAYAWNVETDELEWAGSVDELGLKAAPKTGRAFAELILGLDIADRQRALAEPGKGTFLCEYRVRDRDGGLRWVEERGRAMLEGPGSSNRFVLGVLRSVGDRKARKSRSSWLANYDELTGHLNRTRLREELDRIIAASQRDEMPAVVFCIGVDNMTAINDTFGREAGDGVLIEIGRRLDLCTRVTDLVGRLDEDRFGVLLPKCLADDAQVAAERILEVVRSEPIATPRGPIDVTVSIGGASCIDHGATSYQVISRGEAALAEAKQAGRDCYVHYPLTTEQHEERYRIEKICSDIQRTISEDRLVFAFQPVVYAATGDIGYYECLLRVREADGHIVTAEDFITVVEAAGLIRLIDRHVLSRMAAELGSDPAVRLGFNVSSLTAADRPWLRALMAMLRNRPDFASRLVIEITETAALYDIEATIQFVNAVRECGCRVVLDDFGTAQNLLRHLPDIPVNAVKVGRSSVRNLAANPDKQLFLRHLIALAKDLGLDTVAVGVESAEDATLLCAEGVAYLQGYHIGRPRFDRPWLAKRTAAPPTGARSPSDVRNQPVPESQPI